MLLEYLNYAKIYAFIPARSGSERVKNKNIKLLNGKPLIEYTIDQAKSSQLITKHLFLQTTRTSIAKLTLMKI